MRGTARWTERLEAALGRMWWQPRHTLGAWLLLPLSAVFGALSAARRLGYRRGWLRTHRAGVPVIVVGNLVVGGAGKTPTVIALVHALQRRGWHPGVISRGHGRDEGRARAVQPQSPAAQVGDEALLISRRGGVPVWVARKRPQAADALCTAHPEVDILVADDGLQHLALSRDAEVVVFDERGAGNGWLLPAGPLRQPLPSPKPGHMPAHSVVLYNAPRPSTPLPGFLADRTLGSLLPLASWWQGSPADPQAWQRFGGRELLAAAGIAAPQRFFSMLRERGLHIRTLPLPDHFDFATLPWDADEADVVVTEKDAVKLPRVLRGDTRVWVATLDCVLPDELVTAVLSQLPAPSAHES